MPRPVSLPVECWQPIVSASTRGIEFMLRHGIMGLVGGGAATMAEGPIQAYQRVAHSMSHNLKLGEGLAIGVSFYLAKTREQAIREMLPYYEEHVKMFAPLGFGRASRRHRSKRPHGAVAGALLVCRPSTIICSSAHGSPARPTTSSPT